MRTVTSIAPDTTAWKSRGTSPTRCRTRPCSTDSTLPNRRSVVRSTSSSVGNAASSAVIAVMAPVPPRLHRGYRPPHVPSAGPTAACGAHGGRPARAGEFAGTVPAKWRTEPARTRSSEIWVCATLRLTGVLLDLTPFCSPEDWVPDRPHIPRASTRPGKGENDARTRRCSEQATCAPGMAVRGFLVSLPPVCDHCDGVNRTPPNLRKTTERNLWHP